MSDDRFSWAPFGPSPAEDQETLPPLPPLAPFDTEEPEASVPPPPPSVPPPPVADDQSLDDLRWLEAQEAPAPPSPPARTNVSDGWSDPPAIVPAKPPRKARPKTDAGQAMVWGILGLTLCPVLIPSIAAINMGTKAKRNKRSDQGAAQAAIIMGWIGVAIWALAILVVVSAA
ncbi:MAG TPA: DUF4190 domain-containing protein [Thermoleophilaceae bacterium]|nr:DUF4190 domain-containing protein [Thermoleophilaceae bacterium]